MLFSNYSILVLVLLINMFTTARSLLSSTKLINNRIVTKKYLSSTTTLDSYTSSLETFLTDVAKIEIPKNSNTLLNILSLNENYELVNPSTSRKGLNPFLIPLAKNTKENNLLCYIRWPTQKDGMDLQLVKTTEAGINLVSLSTNQFIHRLAVEDDFYTTKNCDEVISLVNQNGVEYKKGDYMGMIKSGKFPAMSPEDMRLVLDRYLLTKVGQFPDCFERLAQSFLNKNDEVSALVTCERAVAVFYGWGHPIMFHTHMLEKLGRDKEARDSARAAMGMPSWTLATTKEVQYTNYTSF